MTPSDKPEFLRTLVGLAAIKPGKPLTPEGLDLYWLAMQDWSLDEFKQAAAHLSTSIEFMPNPYHFDQLRKAGEETAGEAWEKVRAVIRGAAWGDKPELGPRIDRVVRALGGYYELGMTNTDAMPFREKRFRELWDELGDAEQARAALPNASGGFRITGPQRVTPRLERQ